MLKNYTSEVPAARSIHYIEEKLAAHQATQILKQFGADTKVTSISFTMIIGGQTINFRLPARVDECKKRLSRLVRRPNQGTEKRVADQAERTAWKIVSDWIDAQMAMVELAQVDFVEVFMPYVFDPARQKTFYEMVKENNFKALPAARKDGE